MIGTFFYCAWIDESAIGIELIRAGDGAPMGKVTVPKFISEALDDAVLPSADVEPMLLPVAIAYAVFLGMSGNIPVRITGDRTAWNPAWGPLQELPH